MNLQIRGITDEITACDACGKKHLKKTVVLETEDGEIVHYGTDCAAYAMLGSKRHKDLMWRRAQAISLAKQILPESAERAARAVWDRFGYVTLSKNGAVHIWLENPGTPTVVTA